AVGDHADADALGLRRGQRLDVAPVGADLGLVPARHHRLDLLAGLGQPNNAIANLEQLRHAAVPPMVRLDTRSVGTPSPTGTPWPSLPHVPGGPMAKSLPSASMRVSTSGPLPMRLPSRSGSVILPFSIRYASVMPNTKSPV